MEYTQKDIEQLYDKYVAHTYGRFPMTAVSGKGAVCFRPHNAWGWGRSGWSSWPEAIDSHVSGLARGYGNDLTLDAAMKYCPPTYQDWYNKVRSEMNKI